MTDDIVTRLIAEIADASSKTSKTLLAEAADEIKRLRLILIHICDVWGSDLLSIIDEMNRFKKEIK